jgi:hypothetical protein
MSKGKLSYSPYTLQAASFHHETARPDKYPEMKARS